MMKIGFLLCVLFTLLSSANALTRVAVVELGKRGTVRKIDSRVPLTTVSGVASFWSALHYPGRRVQHAGMVLVPDIFNKAENGMVVGLKGSGVSLDAMPFVNSLLEENTNGVVGHFELDGFKGDDLLNKVSNSEDVDTSAFASSCNRHAKSSGLTGIITNVGSKDSTFINAQLRDVIMKLDAQATAAGNTVVLHLVVEEEEGSSRRRLLSRRLEDEGAGEGDQEQEENQEVEGNNNGNAQQNNGYYGYGYYNSYGEWVTPYKTMFQIQYFNVVLWTAIGLTVILFFTVYLMLYMPLMPDTLLFGESAKLVGDD